MQKPAFEETRPADYLTRAAASDLGKAYKGIAAQEMAIRPGDVILDLRCGAVTAGYLTQDTADRWLDHLATQPFFASTTRFIITATAG